MYLIIIFILVINISPHINLKNTGLHKINLAFNMNIVYVLEPNNHIKNIKQIEIEGINSIIAQKILDRNKIISKSLNIHKMHFTQTIDKIKNSGFIKKMQAYIIKGHRTKYLIIELQVNPLIKKIKIIEWYKLQIPQSLLANIFKQHLGRPKNYLHINNSLKVINHWYKEKGFKWVKIKVINNPESECLSIQIFEGEILDSTLVCKDENKLEPSRISKIDQQIFKELGISPGRVLNINQLKRGIIYLKKVKLISSCTYKIIKHSDSLNIVLKYNVLPEREVCLSMKEIFLNCYSYTLFLNDQFLYIFNLIIQKIILTSPFLRKITSNIILKSTSLFSNSILRINISQIILQKHFSFKYYSFNQYGIKYLKNILIEMKTMGKLPYLNIIYLYPNMKIYNDLYGYLTLKYYQKWYSNYKLFLLKAINIANYKKGDIFHTKIKSRGITFHLKHNLDSNTYAIGKLVQKHCICYKQYLNIKTLYAYPDFDNDLYYNKYEVRTFSKTVQQTFCMLKLSVQYNTLSTFQQLKSGTLFIVELLSYFPDFAPGLIIDKKYVKQYIFIKYHQTLSLPRIIYKIHHSALILLLEANYYLGQQHVLPMLTINYYDDFSVNCGKFNKASRVNLYKPYKYSLEYHLSTHNYYSLYLFYCFSGYLNHDINFVPFIKLNTFTNLYYHSNNIKLGSGIQLNIPINNIPPLRLEYQVNKAQEKFVHISIYTNYN